MGDVTTDDVLMALATLAVEEAGRCARWRPARHGRVTVDARGRVAVSGVPSPIVVSESMSVADAIAAGRRAGALPFEMMEVVRNVVAKECRSGHLGRAGLSADAWAAKMVGARVLTASMSVRETAAAARSFMRRTILVDSVGLAQRHLKSCESGADEALSCLALARDEVSRLLSLAERLDVSV